MPLFFLTYAPLLNTITIIIITGVVQVCLCFVFLLFFVEVFSACHFLPSALICVSKLLDTCLISSQYFGCNLQGLLLI